MPRTKRKKTNFSVYHIMIRSVGDIPLFKNAEDKDYFLKKFKKYKEIFMFKIYSYCLMDTHAHFIIYSNGSDISSIMHGINQSYAQYYNLKYNRHGHVFGDRFKSIIVDDDKYVITLSAYIHKNAQDIPEYQNCIEKYEYSSLGIYFGTQRDDYELIDTIFLMGIFGNDIISGRNNYMKFLGECVDPLMKEVVEFKNASTEYRPEKKILTRDYSIDKVMDFVCQRTGNEKPDIHIKYSHKTIAYRALSILLMRSLCGYSYKQINEKIGNITISNASKLCSQGVEIIHSNDKYKNIINEILESDCGKIS